MIDVGNSILIIAICAACTFLERALPFLLFGKRKVPETIRYLGNILPMAVMAALVIYCLKDISFTQAGNFLPQVISLAVVIALHLWRKNTFLSIACGTVCYMILVQLVF